jgi:hypothetical protein
MAPVLAAVAAAAGPVFSGIAQNAQQRGEMKMDQYNARVMEQQAKATELKTQFQQQRDAQASKRVMSSMEARAGASGAISTSGAPLLAQAQQASELSLQNQMIGYEGMIEAARARTQAYGYRMSMQQHRIAGRYAVLGGSLEGFSSGMSAYSGAKNNG